MSSNIKFVFFGSSRFSGFVLEELEKAGHSPVLNITSARENLDIEKLRALDADVFIVASFGKILPAEIINMPKHGSLNVHPSLLPKLRGPAPIQGTILGLGDPGVTIIKMDEQMDHGPIVAQRDLSIEPFPDHYAVVEEKLARAGGKLLAEILPSWVKGELEEKSQDEQEATYIKMLKKEDGEINLNGEAEANLRKVLAYSAWPQAFFFFKNKIGRNIRIVVKDAKIEDGKFIPTLVVPEGKREMDWKSFLLGNA